MRQLFVRGILGWILRPRVLKLYTVSENILQMCNVEASVRSTKKCRNSVGLNLNELEIFRAIYTPLCPPHFDMKTLSYGSETSHCGRMCNVEVSVISTINCWKKRGSEPRRILDILEYLYSTERLRVCCDVVMTTLCGRICKGNGMGKTDVVRKTSWERRREKDVVKKTLYNSHCEKYNTFDLLLLIDKYWW